ncbi:MAG: prolyl oligopeptidase family serine peptidase [Planctomycetaceae bacterium]|nr:prolyl oligopeptidase family serine peptidase [Planctomycetaceae bacterium]
MPGFRVELACVLVFALAASVVAGAEPIPAIPRLLPPEGIAIDPAAREQLQQQLRGLQERAAPHAGDPLAPDVEVLLAALEWALKFGEFYDDKDVGGAGDLLAMAAQRIDALDAGLSPWTDARGLVVRGYRSSIDDSVQPYGLVIPENLDLSGTVPLYVWLHGRGDKQTNLSFIHGRMTQPGQIAPPNAIVVHPFGRHCLGFKSAGEIDVLEAVEHVAKHYHIDRNLIVLMGFSMGGAGCWHIGAHYPNQWAAMSPGAGFAETARYQSIDPATVPPYEQLLWGAYDVPDYVRNLFNLPVIAYSGENDKQIQAARVMEEAFASEGRTLDHRIGPGMGHKYHPDTLAAILKDLGSELEEGGRYGIRLVASLQTRTLRYHQVEWVDVQRLQEHWRDARVDAEELEYGVVQVTTKNVASLRIKPLPNGSVSKVVIDGHSLSIDPPANEVSLILRDGRWSVGEPDAAQLAKKPGLQGPIDDAFLEPFLVVTPSGKSPHPDVQRWVEFEQQHFLDRWEGVFRGRARVKRDVDVTADDAARYHLILWGDPASNSVLARISDRLPIHWTKDAITAGQQTFAAASHVPVLIYPNPDSPERYVVLNSGPTFREGHDRTNSLQNPKLPDWAVIDLSQPPDALAPGRIAAAEFFDEEWQLRE